MILKITPLHIPLTSLPLSCFDVPAGQSMTLFRAHFLPTAHHPQITAGQGESQGLFSLLFPVTELKQALSAALREMASHLRGIFILISLLRFFSSFGIEFGFYQMLLNIQLAIFKILSRNYYTVTLSTMKLPLLVLLG